MQEQLCHYCQKHFMATIIDRVGSTIVFNVDGEPEEVDVYWCGCAPELSAYEEDQIEENN